MSELSREVYGFVAVAQRELSAIVRTRRFILSWITICPFCHYRRLLWKSQLGNGQYLLASGSPDLKLQPVNYAMSIAFYSYSDIFLSILGLALSYDAITNERTCRTLAKVTARPIRRATVIFGKFSAYIVAAGGLFVVTTLVPAWRAINPYASLSRYYSDFELLLLSMVVIILFLASFVGLGMLISTLTRTNLDSMSGAVFVWVLLLTFAYAGVITGVSAVPTNIGTTTDLPYSQFPLYSKVLLWLNPGSQNVA